MVSPLLSAHVWRWVGGVLHTKPRPVLSRVMESGGVVPLWQVAFKRRCLYLVKHGHDRNERLGLFRLCTADSERPHIYLGAKGRQSMQLRTIEA